MKNNRIRSIDKLKNLVRIALPKKEEKQSTIYKVRFTDEKEKMLVFHHKMYFFEYNIKNKQIIGFARINQCTKSNLNIICKILKIPGEFRNNYKKIGYDLIYYREGKFYDKKMKIIPHNLDKVLKNHYSKINKQRYNKIMSIMSTGNIELDEIPGHRTWLKKINGKWYTFSDLEKDLYFPVLAKDVFAVISSKLTITSVLSKNIYVSTQIYRNRYDKYITKKIDSGEIKKWEIDLKNRYSTYAFRLEKLEVEKKDVLEQLKLSGNKERNNEKTEQWILESKGDITFDKRTMNRSQVKDFIRYILSIELPDPLTGHLKRWDWYGPPDIIKNTPINLLIDENKKLNRKISDILRIVGNEIRISYRNIQGNDNKINKEFVATSIYGKECTIFEHDVDALLRDGFFNKILQRFDEELVLERSYERIALIKEILPMFKSKYPIILDENNKTLTISNKDGEFHISMIDASLSKVVRNEDIYICVGSISDNMNVRPSIIINGIIYEIDFIMDEILSKTIMLIGENYPDDTTERQIKYKR